MASGYLGIDQSFTSTGVVLIGEDGNLGQSFKSQLIRSNAEQDIFERGWYITTSIATIAGDVKPRVIAIEGLAFSKFGNATRDLAGLQMLIIAQLRFVHGYTVEIVSPNLLKKFATTKGNSKKTEMYAALPEDVKTSFTGILKTKGLYDVTDAYWLAKYAYELQKKRNTTPLQLGIKI